MRLPGIIFFMGMACVYVGERLIGQGTWRGALTILGLLLVAASFGIRLRDLGLGDPSRKSAGLSAMIWSGVSTASLVLYAFTTDGFVDTLGLSEEAAPRWVGPWTVLFPIVWFMGAVPTLLLDRALHFHPVRLPSGATKQAVTSGVTAAMALSLLFPLVYLGNHYQAEWDVAYFRTTRAGGSTMALVRSLSEPVQVYLFFSPASEVKEQLLPYFDTLQAESDGLLTYEVVDQPLVPELAEELKVRDNGYVAFKAGEVSEKFKVGTDIDRARRELKKLDSTVQKNLLEISRGQRTAYLLTGHGEASEREKDDPLRKVRLFKKQLESQNYKVADFGLTEGSADAVPDDAALLIVLSPHKELLPEEEQAIKSYLDRGGRLLLTVDPGEEMGRMEDLLAHLGVDAHEVPLAHETRYIPQNRGKVDKVILATNRYGSHEAVKVLSRNSTQLLVFLPTVAALEKVEREGVRTDVLIRSMPETYEDANGNYEQDPDEKGTVFDVALASEGGEGEGAWRAVVVGDVSAFSDPVFQISMGNQQFAFDAVRWVMGDEALVGETHNEEDVKIQHTRDQDTKWFYGTILGVPLLILLIGLGFTRIRRRSK